MLQHASKLRQTAVTRDPRIAGKTGAALRAAKAARLRLAEASLRSEGHSLSLVEGKAWFLPARSAGHPRAKPEAFAERSEAPSKPRSGEALA